MSALTLSKSAPIPIRNPARSSENFAEVLAQIDEAFHFSSRELYFTAGDEVPSNTCSLLLRLPDSEFLRWLTVLGVISGSAS